MLSTSKFGEVPQNCFVFDVVNFEMGEVPQNCFVLDNVNSEKMGTSRRIDVFWMLSIVKFQDWGSLAELLRFHTILQGRQIDR